MTHPIDSHEEFNQYHNTIDSKRLANEIDQIEEMRVEVGNELKKAWKRKKALPRKVIVWTEEVEDLKTIVKR